MATGYTKLIELKVKDDALKKATVRLFRTLEKIEKKLDVIAGKGGKGFDAVAKGAERASRSYVKTQKSALKLGISHRNLRKGIGDTVTAFGALTAGAIAANKALEGTNFLLSGVLKGVVSGTIDRLGGLKTHLLGIAAAHPIVTAGILGTTAAYTLFGTKALNPIGATLKRLPALFNKVTKNIQESALGFRKLNEAVKVTNKSYIEMSKSQGLTGLKQLLASAAAEQAKLLSTNTLYIGQVQTVREIEGAINRELIARQQILDNIVRKEGITSGPGLSGLNKTLAEQQEILDRMLSTQQGYREQAIKVSEVQNLINKELEQRNKIMDSINRKEQKSVGFASRMASAGQGAANLFRPGRGVERRGMGVAGVGAAGLATTGAFKLQNAVAAHSSIGLGKFTVGLNLATAKATGFLGVMDQIGKALIAAPQFLGVAAVAYMIFGKKAFTVPERAAAKLVKTSLGLGTTLGKSLAPEVARINTKLNFTAESAERLNKELNKLPNMQKKVDRSIGVARSSGFGAWSQAAESNKAINKSVERNKNRDTKTFRSLKGIERNTKSTATNTGRTAKRVAQGAAGNKPLLQGGARGALSSAMIGGGFPLLFGQGGLSAIGGGIGGAAGGAIGGGFGFGLSVVGTALGQAMEKNNEFNKSLAVLNARLKGVGDGARITAADIDSMAKKLGVTKEEAMGVLSAFSAFDSAGVRKSLASIYGADASGLDALAQANRKQAALAEVIFQSRQKIGIEKTKELLQQNTINNGAAVELALQEALADEIHRTNIERAKAITWQDRLLAGISSSPQNIVDPAIFGEERAAKIQKEFEEGRLQRTEDFKNNLAKIKELIGMVDESSKVDERLERVNALYAQIGGTIKDGIVDAIEGAIEGTKTLGDVASSVFRQIARMMLNYGVSAGMGAIFPGIKFAANGGPVDSGKPYIVGEKGPELFTPNRSGRIIPNHELGSGGGVSVNVAVDASGSSAQGDEPSAQELGRLIGAAVQSELVRQKRPGGILY